MKGCENHVFARHIIIMKLKGSLSCITCCDTGNLLLWSHPKDRPFFPYSASMRYRHAYLILVHKRLLCVRTAICTWRTITLHLYNKMVQRIKISGNSLDSSIFICNQKYIHRIKKPDQILVRSVLICII